MNGQTNLLDDTENATQIILLSLCLGRQIGIGTDHLNCGKDA